MTTPNGLTHPAADLFPMLDEAELTDLADDIAAKGLNNPIILLPDGTLLDGRNRLAACALASVEPRYTTYTGDDPIGHVVSWNIRHRHLNAGQLAALALEVLALYEAEAANNTGGRPRNDEKPEADRPQVSEHLTEGQRAALALDVLDVYEAEAAARVAKERAPQARDRAAKATGAAGRNVAKAKRVATRAEHDPKVAALFAGVKAGTIALDKAERAVARAERTERREVELANLDEPDDMARLDALGIKLQPYDVWNFGSCHDSMGADHPGRIPGELVCHVLYFFTEPGAVVVDPMAGSGTVLDACRIMGREGHGFDIDLRHERPDVTQHDLTGGWPDVTSTADLIFWDPPYFNKMDNAEIGEHGYIEGSISGMDPDGYLAWIEKRLGEAAAVAKPGATLAFLMSDWEPDFAKRYQGHPGIFIWDYADALRSTGWKLRRHIQCPMPTQQMGAPYVVLFREQRRLGHLDRYLLVAEK